MLTGPVIQPAGHHTPPHLDERRLHSERSPPPPALRPPGAWLCSTASGAGPSCGCGSWHLGPAPLLPTQQQPFKLLVASLGVGTFTETAACCCRRVPPQKRREAAGGKHHAGSSEANPLRAKRCPQVLAVPDKDILPSCEALRITMRPRSASRRGGFGGGEDEEGPSREGIEAALVLRRFRPGNLAPGGASLCWTGQLTPDRPQIDITNYGTVPGTGTSQMLRSRIKGQAQCVI